jgi:protoheme IX farnesyltransferase
MSSTAKAQAMAFPSSAPWARLLDYAALTKPRITFMVTLTAMAGFWMAAPGAADWTLLANALAGVALAAAGAGALNMVWEKDLDTLMRRTAARPLPAGRLGEGEALAFGMLLALAGMAWLAVWVNLLSAALAALTLGSYLFAYTPLKKITTLNTAVGAVPGALPPMIGWAAARGEIGLGAWTLFFVLFLWQLPHFLAIARMYRDDYARAGFAMLPVVDESGVRTGRQMVFASLALLPASLAMHWSGLAGSVYLAGAALLGAAFLSLSVYAARNRTVAAARRLLLASVLYLPLLMALMMFDRAA